MEILLLRYCNLIRLVLTMMFLFPLLLSAETITVKNESSAEQECGVSIPCPQRL